MLEPGVNVLLQNIQKVEVAEMHGVRERVGDGEKELDKVKLGKEFL